MTTEQLLIKRIKVIADWPRNTIGEVGDILYFVPAPTGFQFGHYSDHIKGFPTGSVILPGDVEPYPHLFKELAWYEERKIEEMPEYIQWTSPGEKEVLFFKVEQWLKNSVGVYTAGTKDAYLFIKDVQPATIEEYELFINHKQQ